MRARTEAAPGVLSFCVCALSGVRVVHFPNFLQSELSGCGCRDLLVGSRRPLTIPSALSSPAVRRVAVAGGRGCWSPLWAWFFPVNSTLSAGRLGRGYPCDRDTGSSRREGLFPGREERQLLLHRLLPSLEKANEGGASTVFGMLAEQWVQQDCGTTCGSTATASRAPEAHTSLCSCQ